jgi:hypothetical protein
MQKRERMQFLFPSACEYSLYLISYDSYVAKSQGSYAFAESAACCTEFASRDVLLVKRFLIRVLIYMLCMKLKLIRLAALLRREVCAFSDEEKIKSK